MPCKRPQAYLSEKLPVSQKLCYFKGSCSHNVLHYQQLSIAHYQVSLYANSYLSVITNSVQCL